ncbi:hypothetical protein EWI07_01160 [Sporolactobacillus sp. THM7-4]|nr:hypothetical protein EWI07_01160 [Sporolactobacillus sp. THM7-4]
MRRLIKHWLTRFLILDLILAAAYFTLESAHNGGTSSIYKTISSILSAAEEKVSSAGSTIEKLSGVRRDQADKILIDAPHIRQNPELPRGCEVTSLAMMLQSAGVPVSKLELSRKINKVAFLKNGLYGNPNEGFVGDIRDKSRPGYAVYHRPLARLAARYMPGQIVDLSGQSFDAVLDQLRDGKTVIVITNVSFRPLPQEAFQTWNTDSGRIRITFHEHSVLVTGFDKNSIYFNDPLGRKNTKADRDAFIMAWKQMGSQAVSYRRHPFF